MKSKVILFLNKNEHYTQLDYSSFKAIRSVTHKHSRDLSFKIPSRSPELKISLLKESQNTPEKKNLQSELKIAFKLDKRIEIPLRR
jgi:transcriptional regulator